MFLVSFPRCPFCHEPVRPREVKAACDRCMSWQHAGCWEEHGACSACGSLARLSRAEPGRLMPVESPEPRVEVRRRGLRCCPHCGLDLVRMPYEEAEIELCQGCLGCYTSEAAAASIAHVRQVMFSLAERQSVLGQIAGRSVRFESGGLRASEAREDLSCPDCAGHLRPWVLRGLILYRCPGRGVWFESGDLKRMQILVEADTEAMIELQSELTTLTDFNG